MRKKPYSFDDLERQHTQRMSEVKSQMDNRIPCDDEAIMAYKLAYRRKIKRRKMTPYLIVLIIIVVVVLGVIGYSVYKSGV